jgi:integrase
LRNVDLKLKRFRGWPYEGFTPKGKRPRTIPLNEAAYAAFSKLKSKQSGSEFAFRPYKSIFSIYEQFAALLKKQSLKGSLHDLRHTFASHLAMAGMPVPFIKELLGHTDISTTTIYAHLCPNQFQSAIDNLKF